MKDLNPFKNGTSFISFRNRMEHGRFIISLISIILILLINLNLHSGADETSPANPVKAHLPIVQLDGKLVDPRKHAFRIPVDAEPVLGFKTKDGTLYTLIHTRTSSALFTDNRLKKKELILTGHILPDSQIFQVTYLRSRINGEIHLLYYYCDICAIVALTPEICQCCQEPVRLVEKPEESKAQE